MNFGNIHRPQKNMRILQKLNDKMSIASKILKVSALSSEFYILEGKNMARLKGLTDEAKI